MTANDNKTGLSDRSALPVLEVRDLTKRFEIRRGLFSRLSGYVHAVENVSFSIKPGQTLGLVGESGCGKTTVGRLILKLLEPTEGSIRLENRDITALSPKMMRPIRRQIQIIFQDPYGSLNPRMSAAKLVGEPLIIHGLASGKELKDRVATIFEQVGLRPDQLERYPHEFSGGQRQRLSIARALSVNPKLIIADEAVSALDVSIQASVINLLMDLQQEYNLSYLFIAHDIAVVEYISDYVAVMYLGKIVEMTSRKKIFTNPLHPYTEALLSAVPIPNPKAKKTKRILLKGDIPSPINPPKGCRFHTRCPYVMDICRVEEPVFREVQPEHFASCHLR
jgi:oligopeptide/dipeptide ABC transporter ATP-binding protein